MLLLVLPLTTKVFLKEGVLSPFLFMVYMNDVFDSVEGEAKLVVYADDIILYSHGETIERTQRKLQDALNRLIDWCTSSKLRFSPDKCTAINFSRRRGPDPTIYLQGHVVRWNPSVKILGVWFSRSLSFSYHFAYIRAKCMRRLNYARAVASHSRGVSSYHMIRIVNAVVRSLLEYACPLFYDACPSLLHRLEVIYNAALRVATGLPMCTPIPVLRREAGVCSVVCRLHFLARNFFVKHLSLLCGLGFRDRLLCSLSASQPANWAVRKASSVMDLYKIHQSSLICFSWPLLPTVRKDINIIIQGLRFQNTEFPEPIVLSEWLCWWDANGSDAILVATDASKDLNKTAIAAINVAEDSSLAMLVQHCNSVFTAEALALCQAVTCFIKKHERYVLLTDSKSVLTALENVSLRSPHVILRLHALLSDSIRTAKSVSLIWCPGHKGIPPNEKADTLARNGPYAPITLSWVSPEDIRLCSRRDWLTEGQYEWLNCDYSNDFHHLNIDRSFSRWTFTRWDDVQVARWRAKRVLTRNTLYKMKIIPSPLCPFCHELETPDHVLLFCPAYDAGRLALFNSIGVLPGCSYADIISAATRSKIGTCALLRFSSLIFPP